MQVEPPEVGKKIGLVQKKKNVEKIIPKNVSNLMKIPIHRSKKVNKCGAG